MADQCEDVRSVLHLYDADGPNVRPANEVERKALEDAEASLRAHCQTRIVLVEGEVYHLLLLELNGGSCTLHQLVLQLAPCGGVVRSFHILF